VNTALGCFAYPFPDDAKLAFEIEFIADASGAANEDLLNNRLRGSGTSTQR
jgi:hypothetical protein